MKLSTDDELRFIDRRYLGPPGYDFFPAIRYLAYGIFPPALAVVLLVENVFGIRPGFFGVAVTAGIIGFATGAVCDLVSGDVPFRAVVTTFVAELRAPRSVTTGECAELHPRQVQVHTELGAPPSWLSRWSGLKVTPRGLVARAWHGLLSRRFGGAIAPRTNASH